LIKQLAIFFFEEIATGKNYCSASVEGRDDVFLDRFDHFFFGGGKDPVSKVLPQFEGFVFP
jgi:hypothetical protein